MADDEPSFIPPRVNVYRVFSSSGVPAPSPWRLTPVDGETVHVLPNGDAVKHELSDECVCGPSSRISEHHEECDHPDIWIHQHQALDGRATPTVR